jgi:hypothetical protein
LLFILAFPSGASSLVGSVQDFDTILGLYLVKRAGNQKVLMKIFESSANSTKWLAVKEFILAQEYSGSSGGC